MIPIGEFARNSGLTVKTLRYYDDIGLFAPLEVDEFTGYRHYGAAQLREAALLRVLRAAGVGTADMKRVLANPAELDDVLAARRAAIAAQRALEDWALAAAPEWTADPDLSIVRTRTRPAHHWVAVETETNVDMLTDDADAKAWADDSGVRLQAAAEALLADLLAQVPGQLGGLTMTFTADARRPAITRIAYGCAALAGLDVPGEIDGHRVIRDDIPDTREAYVHIEMPAGDDDPGPLGDGELLPGGPLPARELIALAMYAEAHGGTASGPIRQRAFEENGRLILDYSMGLG